MPLVLPKAMNTGLVTVPLVGSTVLRVDVEPPIRARDRTARDGNCTLVLRQVTSTLGGSTIWFCRVLIATVSVAWFAAPALRLVFPKPRR